MLKKTLITLVIASVVSLISGKIIRNVLEN